MISAHEVRINNYVKCTRGNDAGIYQVFAIDGKGLNIMLNGVREGEWLRDSFHKKPEVKGIKLTEEWFLNFGFALDKVGSYYQKQLSMQLFVVFWHDNILAKNANGDSYLEQGEDEEFHQIKIPIKLKYVHQLQNLYYALTQNELTIQ